MQSRQDKWTGLKLIFLILNYGQNYLKVTEALRMIPEKSDQSSHSSTVLSFLTGRIIHSLRQSLGQHLWLFWNNLSTAAFEMAEMSPL